jgi:hypothetical protein
VDDTLVGLEMTDTTASSSAPSKNVKLKFSLILNVTMREN